jgi:hypothetical protein
MEWTIYVFLFALATLSIAMGVMMIVNAKFRNDTATKWYKSESLDQQNSFQKSVKFVGGPLYFLAGLLICAYGIWLLDVHLGILRNVPVLRSIIDSFVQ